MPAAKKTEKQADEERRYGEEIHVEEDAGLEKRGRKEPQYYTKSDLDPDTALRPGEQPAPGTRDRSLLHRLDRLKNEVSTEKGADISTEERTALTALETAIEFYQQVRGTRKV